MIDIAAVDPADPLAEFNTVRQELALFKAALTRKPMLVVLNKIDLPEAEDNVRRFRALLPDLEILEISARNGEGLTPLKTKIIQFLESALGDG